MTADDRCDRCGAQAFFVAFFATGLLTLCGHHGRQYRSAMELVALEVIDCTADINPRPGVASGSGT